MDLGIAIQAAVPRSTTELSRLYTFGLLAEIYVLGIDILENQRSESDDASAIRVIAINVLFAEETIEYMREEKDRGCTTKCNLRIRGWFQAAPRLRR